MAIFFRDELLCFVRRTCCCALLAGVCLALGCHQVPSLAGRTRVVNLPELCKLSLEELLRVTVIEDARRHLPVLSLIALIDLSLEDLLMIDVVGHPHPFGAKVELNATAID